MPTPICVLNLSPVNVRNYEMALEVDPQVLTRLSRAEPRHIQNVDDIPLGEKPDDEALILYIVAHGVPNGVMSGTRTIREAQLARQIRAQRGEAPTLIIWDVCFAKSFLDIPGLPAWPASYVHIFSCEAHERTWQKSNGTQPRARTLFSTELSATIAPGAQLQDWARLEQQLQRQLDPIQKPSIHPKNRLQPNSFV
jgi:hypothetical protein